MYAPNNHTCSVIPHWKVDNSVLSMERRKKNKNSLIRVEKIDMVGLKKNVSTKNANKIN